MKKRSEQWSLHLVLVHGLLATFLLVACGQVVSVGEPERVGEVAEALTDRSLLELRSVPKRRQVLDLVC